MRRKRYWLFWGLLILIVLSVLARQYYISQVPYIDPPYDVEAFQERLHEQLQEGDAYEEYFKAWESYQPLPNYVPLTYDPVYQWKHIDQESKAAVLQNEEALNHWLQGVEQPWRQNNGVILSFMGQDTSIIPHKWSSVRTWELLWLSLLEASRLNSLGEPEEAWKYQLSSLKYLYQPEIARQSLNRNGVELRVVQKSFENFLAEKNLTPKMLKKMSSEIALLKTGQFPISDEIKTAYLTGTFNLSNRGKWMLQDFSNNMTETWYWEDRLDSWTGKTEMRRRRHDLAYQNALHFCDLPIAEQPTRVVCDWWMQIYDTDGAEEKLEVTSQEFMALNKITGTEHSMLHLESALLYRRLLQSFREGMSLLVALQRFHREQGKFPDTLEKLVPGYIAEIPSDSFAPDKRVQYRRENGKAILWSVGPDLTDESGTSDFEMGDNTLLGPGDVIFHAWKPGSDLSQQETKQEKIRNVK